MTNEFRRCNPEGSNCGYCFPAKNPDKVICEYSPAMHGADKPEELNKKAECKYQLLKLGSK